MAKEVLAMPQEIALAFNIFVAAVLCLCAGKYDPDTLFTFASAGSGHGEPGQGDAALSIVPGLSANRIAGNRIASQMSQISQSVDATPAGFLSHPGRLRSFPVVRFSAGTTTMRSKVIDSGIWAIRRSRSDSSSASSK